MHQDDDSQKKTIDGKDNKNKNLIIFFQNYLKHSIFSSLTRRILFLNLTALAIMVIGILYLNRFRDGLIGARIESLMIQGEIIAGAISASVKVETNISGINPEKLLELQAGESVGPEFDNFEFLINPERVAPVLRRLLSSIDIRARIYDQEGNLLMDSRHLYSRGQIIHYNLRPMKSESSQFFMFLENWLPWFFEEKQTFNNDLPQIQSTTLEAVMSALKGNSSTLSGKNKYGEQIVSVAVPIQRFHSILGVLVLSTEGGDIDKIIRNERKAILRVFGVAALANSILSILLASTIASPLRRLSAAAVRIRRGIKTQAEIPDFSSRQDEIGNLSVAMRDMTKALYGRIEAIEKFAADVSHELKNPLTSLRSAVEVLPVAKEKEKQIRLMDIIQHDVRRLDRLITDISNASRLDAELARGNYNRINVKNLLENLIAILKETAQEKKEVDIHLTVKTEKEEKNYDIMGHDLRLSQVITNLIENARSFCPKKSGEIRVQLCESEKFNIILIEDNGPGISAENIDRIFERFYTDRPTGDAFGQNSGLGLSISRQIVESHAGTLTAENIVDSKTGKILGARFIVSLPKIENS